MIRILTLLVSLFSFGLVQLAEINYEIPVTDMLYFNHIPIEELNGLTLNEVFNDGNLLINGDFSDGSTDWNLTGPVSIVNEKAVFSATNTTTFLRLRSNYNLINGNYYYISFDFIDLISGKVQLVFDSSNFPIYDTEGTYSLISNNLVTNFSFERVAGFISKYSIDNVYILNLTSLGLTSLTKIQLDRYYELWLNPELNITYEINELDTQDLIILLASQSVWTIMIHLLYKYAYRPKKKLKRLGM